MQKVNLPPDHNDTFMTYPRSMKQAFDKEKSPQISIEPEKISRAGVLGVLVSLMLWLWLVLLLAK